MTRTGVKVVVFSAIGVAGLGVAAKMAAPHLGRQSDGSYLVSSGQHIAAGTFAFNGRPIDLALQPGSHTFAIMNQGDVFLAQKEGEFAWSHVKLDGGAGFRGLVWSPDGRRLFASTEKGPIQTFDYKEGAFTKGPVIDLKQPQRDKNPVPGGMCVTNDGKTLYVACVDLNAVVQVDLTTNKRVKDFPAGTMPFEVKLSGDEKNLVVSNWGGKLPSGADDTAKSEETDVEVDEGGIPNTGTATIIPLDGGSSSHLDVGLHPNAIAVDGNRAFVCNSMSDTISEIDISGRSIARTIAIKWGKNRLLGSMPNALALTKERIYVCDGGDNAVAEIDRKSGRVLGFRPVGYFPTALALDGNAAYVLNNKGNGSVRNTNLGKPGNAHDFQGTISVVDLSKDLKAETQSVALNNNWDQPEKLFKPDIPVYRGAIKHVIYIIKENRTYDQIYGNIAEGNGDAKLCDLGPFMPNHQALAKEFTLFDNSYVSGTNSAEGHNWCVQAMANEYVERFYVGYSRTYPDEGNDAMALNPSGALWNVAVKAGKSVRIYGEYCDSDKAKFEPRAPKDWFEAWEDRKNGGHSFKAIATSNVASMRPLMNRNCLFWPLLQSDQWRADEFIKEYSENSKADKVPDLMIMSLPCDHSEGVSQEYPTPRSMMADNDLALGRIVEAVSHSPQWKDTAIFVTEDDAQAGPDHVDGHRTSWLVLSPYTKRQHVDSSLYCGPNMLRSIEVALGLPPMNRFDALSVPMVDCFQSTPDLTPYVCKPNTIPLDERNPTKSEMTDEDKYWLKVSNKLDWSSMDRADPVLLNKIIWHSVHREDGRPYPK